MCRTHYQGMKKYIWQMPDHDTAKSVNNSSWVIQIAQLWVPEVFQQIGIFDRWLAILAGTAIFDPISKPSDIPVNLN